MKHIFLSVLFLFIAQAQADISLNELGLNSNADTSVSVKFEKEMRQRHSMLKTHEILGLTTFGLMTATMLTGGSAMDDDKHMLLGMTTGAFYLATAYFSLTAPKPDTIKDKARMKWHKGLAWVHFPLMILVPVLGYMYKKHEEDGKSHSSLEKQHSTFAGLLYGSFTISAALMVVEF